MKTIRSPGAIPTPVGLAGALVGSAAAYAAAGFIGVGVLGSLVAFIAVRVDLEKDGVVGHPQATGLYAQQAEARARMTGSERAEQRAESRSLARPLTVAKAVGAVLMIIGFGGFLLLQLPA